jgi:hypothetical protein
VPADPLRITCGGVRPRHTARAAHAPARSHPPRRACDIRDHASEPRVREDPEAAHAEAKRTIERDPLIRVEEHIDVLLGTWAASMVAAQMIDGAIADVRKQLGASYGLDATLFESRLSTHVRIGGFVAAERAQEALALVRERIGRLAAGDAAAAALFVAARRDVMARLASVEPGASALASLAESAVELGRPLGANLTAAEDARRLTPSQMASELGAIDLARAAVFLHGPREAVTRGYAALGRTPRVISR